MFHLGHNPSILVDTSCRLQHFINPFGTLSRKWGRFRVFLWNLHMQNTQSTTTEPWKPSVMTDVLSEIAAKQQGASLGSMLATVQQHGCQREFKNLIQRLFRRCALKLQDDPSKGVPAKAHLTHLDQGALRVLNQQKLLG